MDSSIVKVIDVGINEIIPNRFQPRRQFDEDEIMELSESIRKHGIIQPLVVRPTAEKYEIIAGERRYKAAVLAGLEYVPVIVKNLTDKESAELAIIENIQRKNLSAIEEALSYKKILDMGFLTQEDLANKIGKNQLSVEDKIKLLNLSDEVQEALLENKISERHARSLLRISDEEQQNKMLERIINERLTVKRTDEEIEKLKEIESGEIKMNGETEISSIPQTDTLGVSPNVSSVPTFDIFGSEGNGTQPEFAMPQIPAQPEVAPQPEFAMPQMPAQPEVALQPEITIPTTSPIIEQPEPVQQPEFATPQVSVLPEVEPQVNVQTPPETIAEPVTSTPEPIIVTDYTKQYDPVMPNVVEPVPKAEFKEVIDAIRECSAKIEQYGYIIDVEEYDLANLYQVVFKVEK